MSQVKQQLQSAQVAGEVTAELNAVTKIRAEVRATADGYEINGRTVDVQMRLPITLTPKQVARIVSYALDSVDGFTKDRADE